MSATIRIVVIDHLPIYRAGVIRMLCNEPGFEVVGEGSSAEDAIKLAAERQPDLMILDVSIPGGLLAVEKIADFGAHISILMLTVMEDDGIVISALKAGANAYVLKCVTGSELIRTIRNMLEGDSFISPELAARILSEDDTDWSPATTKAISGLGRNILSLVISGTEPREIANQLGLELQTVQREISAILEHLQDANGSATGLNRTPLKRQLH